MKIPFIHDHHTHVSLYAALVDCLDIGHCPNHASVMKQFSSLTPDKLHIVLGWDSSRFALDEEDLASVAPVLVNDRSLHGFLLNAPARALLQSQYPDIVTKYRDVAFRERFVARIMQMLVAYAGVNEEKLKRFLALRRMEGISAVTEMLLTGESLWTIYDQLDSPPPLVCYTDPAIYLELSPPVRARRTTTCK